MLKSSELKNVRGRETAYMICDHVQATGRDESAQGISDLFNICIHDDDVQGFDTK